MTQPTPPLVPDRTSRWLRHWFLIVLTGCIVGGLLIGAGLGAEHHRQVEQAVGPTIPKVMVAIVLILMSITLPSADLGAAMVMPGPVLWACVVNLVLVPLLAWPLSLLQGTEDFRLGLLIAASVPSTMAASSVWTRKAGGNDAISLLVTAVTNGICFLVSPFWLRVLGGSNVDLDAWQLVQVLVVSALIPIATGQLLRQPRSIAVWVDTHKTFLGVLAQGCLLTLVFWAAFQSGPKFQQRETAGPLEFVGVWMSCIVLHLGAMGIAMLGAKWARFRRRDAIAVAFAASQKTLPIGILLANEVGLPLALFPMLMFHASQLFIDTPIAAELAKSQGLATSLPATNLDEPSGT